MTINTTHIAKPRAQTRLSDIGQIESYLLDHKEKHKTPAPIGDREKNIIENIHR